jgi:hypothetical protein
MHAIVQRTLIVLSLAVLAPPASRAAESYDSCTGFIRTLPATIATRGIWCLDSNLVTSITSGDAILVTGHDITVECNGHRIDGSAAGVATSTRGVVSHSRNNIKVRGCTIVGFRDGVALIGDPAGTSIVEDNRFVNNRHSGIFVIGPGALARRNLVRDTGGSLVPSGVAYGIRTMDYAEVRDNIIDGVRPAANVHGIGHARGIYAWASDGVSIRDNIVRGLVPTGTGTAYGIYVYAGSGEAPMLRGNDVTGPGIARSYGLICLDVTGPAQDNFVTGMARSYYGCTDAGRNYPAVD